MKKLLVILILGMLSCKKEIPNIVTPQTKIVDTIVQTKDTTLQIKKVEYQLFFDFDSLKRVSGYEIMNGPIIVDYDNNGKLDIIVNRRNMSRTATTYIYEMLNPVVILDNGQIKEITNLWKGGTTSSVADYNGDGYKDIVIGDTGPEYWDLHGNPPKPPLVVYWNNKGIFDGSNTIVKPLTNGLFTIASVDTDNDGKFDIIPMGDQFEDDIYSFDGSSFKKKAIVGLPNISQSSTIFEDFNNDKIIDVFAYGFSKSGKLSEAKPTIIYNFNTPTNFNIVNLPDSQYINVAVTGDFKGNGLKDIIFVCLKQGAGGMVVERKHYIYYYENMGNGNFVLNNKTLPEYVIPKSGYPMMYLAKDVDGDGDVDFYNANSNYKALFINDGKGNFKSAF